MGPFRAATFQFHRARAPGSANPTVFNNLSRSLATRSPYSATASVLARRSISTTPAARAARAFKPTGAKAGDIAIRRNLQSSMYVRGFGAALVSVLGYGAWSVYNSNSTDAFGGILPFGSSPDAAATVAPGGATGDAATKIGQDGSQHTRQVLVVSANELHTGSWVGDGPISKTTDSDGRKVLEMLTPEQATQKLRKNEQSFWVNRGQGVVRYDLAQLASNDPIEDDHSERIVEVPNKTLQVGEDGSTDWMFWGVFDGHSGWTTSAKLRQTLIRYVAQELNTTYTSALTTSAYPSSDVVDAAIKKGFTRLDNEIVHESVSQSLKAKSKNLAAELLAPALSGSCALLSYYDPQSKTVRVACTGDSRAVLGRRSPKTGMWTATALSSDQTGSNPDEAERMRKEHPGEEKKVVRNGRVLGGLEPTRAFGDAIYKWSLDTHQKLRQSFFVRSVSPDLLTPPYVTAEPVVTNAKVEPGNGDFMVMATDGLWEMLTNEEVVGLVGKWLEAQGQGKGMTAAHQNSGKAANGGGGGGGSIWNKLWAGGKAGQLPVHEEVVEGNGAEDGQKTPIRIQQWGAPPAKKERYVVKDENVATHLVRNALGGKNDEQVCALLTLPSPYSRRYRDDLTVTVIFFGEPEAGKPAGGVEVNEGATAPVKAKL